MRGRPPKKIDSLCAFHPESDLKVNFQAQSVGNVVLSKCSVVTKVA